LKKGKKGGQQTNDYHCTVAQSNRPPSVPDAPAQETTGKERQEGRGSSRLAHDTLLGSQSRSHHEKRCPPQSSISHEMQTMKF
jgi:hypothetical protein